jgi:uncharacterized protein YjdB
LPNRGREQSTRWRNVVIAALLLLTEASCRGSADEATSVQRILPVLTTLSVQTAMVSLVTQQTAQLKATTLDQGGQTIAASIAWTTSAPNVATISTGGLVTAIAPGTATVTVTAAAGDVSLTRTIAVTVSAPPGVTSVSVNPPALAVIVGATGALAASVVADSGVSTTVIWSSSNVTAATVSGAGVVVAASVGVAQVCATSTFDSAKQGCATVSVIPVPVASVAVTPPSQSLYVGQAARLVATTRDASGASLADRTIAWSSSNASVATVSTSGQVDAIAQGTATISATSEGRTGAAIITVLPGSVPIDGTYALESFDGAALPATIAPGIVVDFGFATLWPSGYYDLYVRRFVNASPENYINTSGHWTAANGALQFLDGGVTSTGTGQASGRLSVSVPYGTVHALTYVRTGIAPAPPVRPFGSNPPPSFTGSLNVTGSGKSMVLSTTLTVANTDVIPHTISFSAGCQQAYLWLQVDSVRWGNPAWTSMDSAWNCSPASLSDTIAVGSQKSYSDRHPATDLTLQSGGLLPAGRYYAWVIAVLDDFYPFYPQYATVRLGWVTIDPTGP